jgi:hypothetical protein
VGRIGYYLPFAVASGVLATIGSGLTTTLTPTTATVVWIGYQILMGAGRGMGIQIPIVAVQNNAPKEEISTVNALVVFSQNLGGVVWLTLAQVVFSNRLRYGLATYAPDVNPELVIVAGARGVREAVPAALLPVCCWRTAKHSIMSCTSRLALLVRHFSLPLEWVGKVSKRYSL